jgi:hypothetical protein
MSPKSARTLKVFAADGSAMRTEPARSKARRFSAQCAADQAQLAALYCEGAHHAEILTDGSPSVAVFQFDAQGYPQFLRAERRPVSP